MICTSTAFRATAEKGTNTFPFAGVMTPSPINFTAGLVEGKEIVYVWVSVSIFRRYLGGLRELYIEVFMFLLMGDIR